MTSLADKPQKRLHGLSYRQYDTMLKQQGGCAICGKLADTDGKQLAVDHDHATGLVRGLLCTRCNRAIGAFEDSPYLLERAADYLRKAGR